MWKSKLFILWKPKDACLLHDKLAFALFRNLEKGVARHVLHARVLFVHELQREEGGVRNVECQRQRESKRRKIAVVVCFFDQKTGP